MNIIIASTTSSTLYKLLFLISRFKKIKDQGYLHKLLELFKKINEPMF